MVDPNEYLAAMGELIAIADGVALSLATHTEETYESILLRLEQEHPVPAPLLAPIGSDLAVMLLRQLIYLDRLAKDQKIPQPQERRVPQYGPAPRRPA